MEILWDLHKVDIAIHHHNPHCHKRRHTEFAPRNGETTRNHRRNDKIQRKCRWLFVLGTKLSGMSRRASDWCDISSIYVVTDSCAQYAHTHIDKEGSWLISCMNTIPRMHIAYHVRHTICKHVQIICDYYDIHFVSCSILSLPISRVFYAWHDATHNTPHTTWYAII